jgi:hypothetical protein
MLRRIQQISVKSIAMQNQGKSIDHDFLLKFPPSFGGICHARINCFHRAFQFLNIFDKNQALAEPLPSGTNSALTDMQFIQSGV